MLKYALGNRLWTPPWSGKAQPRRHPRPAHLAPVCDPRGLVAGAYLLKNNGKDVKGERKPYTWYSVNRLLTRLVREGKIQKAAA